jgi:hypothetical protein
MLAIPAANPFDRNDLPARQQTNGHQTTVDGAVSSFARAIAFHDDYRARAAIALGAAFFGASQALVPQKFQKRRIGRTLFRVSRPAIQNKFKRAWHILSLYPCHCLIGQVVEGSHR